MDLSRYGVRFGTQGQTLPKEIKMETRHLTEADSRRRRTKISRLNVN
jgi:hypothetical protein